MSLVCPFLRDRLSCCYYKTRLLSSRTMRFVLRIVLWHCCLEPSKMYTILGSCMSPQVLLRLVSHGACSLHSTCPVLTMICLRLYLVQEIRNSIGEPCYTVWLKRSNLCASMRFSAHVPLKKFKLIFYYLVIPAMSHLLWGCSQWSCVTDESMRCLVYRSVQALWVHR